MAEVKLSEEEIRLLLDACDSLTDSILRTRRDYALTGNEAGRVGRIEELIEKLGEARG